MDCLPEQYAGDILDNKVVQVDFTEFLTPAHKLVFLKHLQRCPQFMNSPEDYPTIIEELCLELNKICEEISASDWISLMKCWISFVRDKSNEIRKTKKTFSFSIEDYELLNMVNKGFAVVQSEPSTVELSCILDHLEIAHNSPQIWSTISMELEKLGSRSFTEEQWKKIFDKWCVKVKRKKHVLDEIEIQDTERESFLNPLEQRLIEHLQNADYYKKEEMICRICLETKTEEYKDIHINYIDSLTIAEKINECANVPQITKDDGFPQSICESCLNLLEKANRFRSLCESSDTQLRNMNKNITKEEFVEYIIGDITEFDVQQIENLQEKDSKEEPFTINDAVFEDDYNDKECDYKDAQESCSEDVEATDKPNTDTDNIQQCDQCGVICYNKHSLKKHIHSHSVARPHRCSVCCKEFKTKLTLRVHMRSHTGERPYVCEVCGKAFTQECSLSYHRSIHTGEKKYLCSICDYRGRNVNDLKIHIRTHTGDKPYHCTKCPSKFTTSSNLHKHLRRHTGVKDFKSCGKAFKTWSAVSNHRAIHSDQKKFKCDHCPYKGNTKANLQIHSRTHTGIQPYACDQCPLKFSTASNRNKHIKNVHEKLKLHKCTSCSRSFFSRESARKHMVIHTGLKPYCCTECEVAYGWYNGLQKHMKTNHPGVKIPTEKYFINIMEKQFS